MPLWFHCKVLWNITSLNWCPINNILHSSNSKTNISLQIFWVQRQIWAFCSCWPCKQICGWFRGCPPNLSTPNTKGNSASLQQQGVSWGIISGFLHHLLCQGHQGKTWRHLPHSRPGTVSPNFLLLILNVVLSSGFITSILFHLTNVAEYCNAL